MGTESSKSESPKEMKTNDETETKLNERIKELENLVTNVKSSIEGDETLPNLVHNFSKLLQKPDLLCFKEVVDAMDTNWKNVSKCLEQLSSHILQSESEEMEQLQTDYWLLLLKTKSMIGILSKKCKLQQRYVGVILEIIEKRANLSDDDKKAHSQCIKKLGEWMNIEELDTLFDDWTDISKRLKAKQLSWEELAGKLKGSAKAGAWKCAKWIGIILSVSAVVTIIVFSVVAISATTAGSAAAPAVAAGGVAVKTVAIGGYTILASHALGIGIGAGLLAVGGGTYASYKFWQHNNEAYKAYRNANNITNMIKEMIVNAAKIHYEISNLNNSKDKINTELEGYLGDDQAVQLMEKALVQINEHLSEYIEQCKVVTEAVHKACKTYI